MTEVNSECTGIFAVVPSVVKVGEPFWAGVKVLTEPYFVGAACYSPFLSVRGRYNLSPRGIAYMDNVPRSWTGSIQIEGGESYEGPTYVSFKHGQGPYPNDHRPIRRIGPIKFTKPGLHFVTFKEPCTGITQLSNPIWVCEREPAERLFWGDIHSQTFFSDGLRCPEELYSFARDEAFLDIFALSDHSEMLSDRQWEYFIGVTNDFNDPGRFVTLVGLEWTSQRWGHRNVYFPGESGPILRCNDPVWGELPNLYEAARLHGALVIPHHSANAVMGVDWSLGHDPEVERLVEIYSIWGNSERAAEQGNPRPIRVTGGEKKGQHVVDALRLGRRFGFIGGGDIHDGRPGDELHIYQRKPEEYRRLHRQGLMGVWARDLTRECIFEALWNRRVYAATNVRIILRFHIAGHPMGSQIKHTEPVPISVECASEVPISRIDLVRNGTDHLQIHPDRRQVCWSCQDQPETDTTWYYVRVTREDGEMAWSSPIWIIP